LFPRLCLWIVRKLTPALKARVLARSEETATASTANLPPPKVRDGFPALDFPVDVPQDDSQNNFAKLDQPTRYSDHYRSMTGKILL